MPEDLHAEHQTNQLGIEKRRRCKDEKKKMNPIFVVSKCKSSTVFVREIICI